MITLILPGSSLKNKDWALEAKNFLEPEIPVKIYEWTHWSGGTEADFNAFSERDKILQIIGSQNIHILAKSIGTLITCLLSEKIAKQIDKIILCGIPMGVALKEGTVYSEELQKISPEKIRLFQNKNDPYGNFTQASEFIKKINPDFKMAPMPRSDHHYPYYREFKTFLLS